MTGGSTPPLPREIEADPGHEVIRARLRAGGRRLWPGGQAVVPVLPLRPALAGALGAAYRDGRLVLGLERVEAVLAAEARGLALVSRRPRRAPGARVSGHMIYCGVGVEGVSLDVLDYYS